jgi:pimeloyl-ACP methyl ester carboxylesterase
MPTTKANGIELCWEGFGEASDPAVLLIMGYTAQMISWDEGFCEMLAGHGFRVIRFDNRDCGLSHKTQGPPPDLRAPAEEGRFLQLAGDAAYTLRDMAADAAGLLDAIGIDAAHVVGASMGGMIAQNMAIEHPHRVLTLTSIMSSTGNPGVGHPTPEAIGALLVRPPAEREAFIEHSAKVTRITNGPLWDEQRARERAARAHDRSYYPQGAAFQTAAIITDGDRTKRLWGISAPTLVIHGRADSLIGVSGGEATAAAIPGAELLVFDEMGHDLPPKLWPQITGAIAKLASTSVIERRERHA